MRQQNYDVSITNLTNEVSLKKQFIIFFIISQQLVLFSQTKLDIEVNKLKADASLQHASWSVCVMPTKKDSVIYEYNSEKSLIPASTFKTLTTGAALSILGSGFKFETKIKYDGLLDIMTGTLHGNIYIIGGGDPTLDSKYFKTKNDTTSTTDIWAAILKGKGIRKVTGQVIADASIFEENTIPSQWIWSDIGNYFGAGAAGLSYHDNSYTLYLQSSNTGTKTKINKSTPYIPNLKITNNVIANGKKDSAYIYGAPYSFHRIMEGSIPPNRNNFKVKGSIPDPALYCAQSLTASLKKFGVTVTSNAITVRQLKQNNAYTKKTLKPLYTHYSPTLSKVVYWCNVKSINLYAENLLKYLAYKKSGLGTEQVGTQVIADFWKGKGVNTGGLNVYDGSGLSRANTITTKTQTQILRTIANSKSYYSFNASLPIAGKSGSMRRLCKGSAAENNLRAKSGYLTNVRAYTGYVTSKKGEQLCFSIIVNNYSCSPYQMKLKIEKLLVALAEIE